MPENNFSLFKLTATKQILMDQLPFIERQAPSLALFTFSHFSHPSEIDITTFILSMLREVE